MLDPLLRERLNSAVDDACIDYADALVSKVLNVVMSELAIIDSSPDNIHKRIADQPDTITRLRQENAELRGRLAKYDGHQSITETELIAENRNLQAELRKLSAAERLIG